MKRRKYLIGLLAVICMMAAGCMFLTQKAEASENDPSVPEITIPVATEPALPEIVIPVATETPSVTPEPTTEPEPTATPEPVKTPPSIFHIEYLDDCVYYDEKGRLAFDKEEIAEFLNDTYNKNAAKAKSARIVAGDTEYYIQKQVKGKQVDVEKLLKDLKPNVKRIKLKDYYIQPEVKAADLKADCRKLNRYVNWQVQYDNGSIIKAGIENVRYKDGQIYLKKAFLKDAVKNVLNSYNSADNTGYFVNHAGKKIPMSGGTFKISTDYAKEIVEICSLYENAKCQKNRSPIYNSTWDRYIEVSLSEQHLWYMENGKVKKDSPVVTGTNTNPGLKTPAGVYKIIERVPGKYLVGPGYRTWVNQWMRLTWSGIGLHDAYWRPSSDFANKNTYQYNGSHGCINLPKDFAAWLYPNTFEGMVVVVY